MALIKCPECGNQVSDKSSECVHCGFPIYMKVNGVFGKKECAYCGTVNDGSANRCVSCGAVLEETMETPIQNDVTPKSHSNEPQTYTYSEVIVNVTNGKPKNKWVAFWLCFFLGYFGAHKFYEGKIGMGILYVFTMGLFGIGWIVDCVKTLMLTNPYYVTK